MAVRRVALLVCLAAACGKGTGSQPHPAIEDAAGAPKAVVPAALVEIPALPLGLPELAGFQWRKRAGQPAFRAARKAEARARAPEDWAAVISACREALAADPGHLEASWLLAAALGHAGHPASELLAPLQAAVAGDFGKWATPSLEHPALQPFLATPTGLAWKRRIEEDRAAFVEALGRATVVVAAGELFAFDPKSSRFLRLTRTGGAVVGALPSASGRELAYVFRQGPKGKRELAVGVIDLARGHTGRGAAVGTLGPITIAYSAKPPVGFRVAAGKPASWRVVDDGKLAPVPGKPTRPPGPRLEVNGRSAHRLVLPLPAGQVTADWDDQGLASALRIGSSNRVVAAPSPSLIDGNTVTWSPDHSHLAFVAQVPADTTCTPGVARATAFLADAATGALQPLYTPKLAATQLDTGLSVEWLTDRTLAVASVAGVTILGLDGPTQTPLVGARELVIPRSTLPCTPDPATTTPDDDPATPEDPDAPEVTTGVEPVDGGVVGPP